MCPAIIKAKLPFDQCLKIEETYPRLQTVIIDDCEADEICDFTGVYGGFVWPRSQAVLAANNLNMKNKYVDANGNVQTGKHEAFCVKAKEYLNG
jgi:hypothetical protein